MTAFDLAGAERGFSSSNFQKAFKLIHEKLINVTLHAGEGTPPEYVKDAIRFCGAHRIGHGVGLRDDLKLLKFVADAGIAVEVIVAA